MEVQTPTGWTQTKHSVYSEAARSVSSEGLGKDRDGRQFGKEANHFTVEQRFNFCELLWGAKSAEFIGTTSIVRIPVHKTSPVTSSIH